MTVSESLAWTTVQHSKRSSSFRLHSFLAAVSEALKTATTVATGTRRSKGRKKVYKLTLLVADQLISEVLLPPSTAHSVDW